MLAAPYTIRGHDVQTNISIGIAMGGRTEDAHELLRQGSIAVHEARQAAPGSTVVFDQTMHDRLSRRFRIEVALRQAVPRREFSVLYQPIVDIDSGRLMAVEPVLHWNSPELGSMSASEFIPIADEVGLSMEINQWMLRESCMQWSRWQQRDAATAPALMSVSASRAQVASGAALLGACAPRSSVPACRSRSADHIAESDLTADRTRALALTRTARDGRACGDE